MKEALREAFEEQGGVPSLVAWAKGEPTEFYKLWARMLPTEIAVTTSAGFLAAVEAGRTRKNPTTR